MRKIAVGIALFVAALFVARIASAQEALWFDLPFGLLVANTNDANQSVERYGGHLGAAGVGLGFLPSMRLGKAVIGLHFSAGGTPSNRDARYEVAGAGGAATPASSALSLTHSEVGMDFGYVVWSTDRAFLYPIGGLHRYDETVDWSTRKHPGQHSSAMGRAGLGLFVGVAIERSLDLSEGRARTFVGARAGALLHLAKADIEGEPADFEPHSTPGAFQSAVVLLTLGVGYARP